MPDIFLAPQDKTPADSIHPPPEGKASVFKKALSSYLYLPDQVKFETQEPDETIILLLRRHWITNFFWVFVSVILVLLPLLLFPFLGIGGFLPEPVAVKIAYLFTLIWYLLTFSYILVNFLLWYFTVSIVTNERIIDIDFSNILHKKFAETRIPKIEDVTLRSGGFIRSLFDFGDVVAQTAASEAVFLFMAVPHPEKVVRTINMLMGKEEHQ